MPSRSYLGLLVMPATLSSTGMGTSQGPGRSAIVRHAAKKTAAAVQAEPEVEDADAKAKELLKMERMGLTPDWIIQVHPCPVLCCTSAHLHMCLAAL